MNGLCIRQASVWEIDTLMAWRMEVIREVFGLHDASAMPALEQANRAYYLRAIPAGEHIACLAVADGQTVGCGGVCLQREMPSPDNPGGGCAYLMNIYVRPAWRRQHVGSQIVTWLVGEARRRGITKIYLETSDMGRTMYRHLGFEDMKNLLKLCLQHS